MVFHKAGAKENSRSNLEKETQKPTGVKAPKENHLLPQKGKKNFNPAADQGNLYQIRYCLFLFLEPIRYNHFGVFLKFLPVASLLLVVRDDSYHD